MPIFLKFLTLFILFFNKNVYAQGKDPTMIKLEAEKKFNEELKKNTDSAIQKRKRKPKSVKINFKWKKKNFDLPIKVYELNDTMVPRLREYRNTQDIHKSISIVKEVNDSGSFISGKEFKTYALAIENKTNEPKWFFAAPHFIDPIEEGIGSKFVCLCRGTIYRIKPNHTWYIIMMVRLFPSNRSTHFTFTHDLIGITEGQVPMADNIEI